MEYQSLYRRYRPGRFADVRGQEHVIAALQNAVREDRVGHAYLLSGPRGTGKTTLARIMAKVLNCEHPSDGEPDCTCESCLAIDAGRSFDLHELDAASNNGVEDMRRLIEKVNLGTPGRNKVYLLDEVHMLSKGAENALLKTLEEPPDHVVFVLATTEPHKVVATIRSRTQHLELNLLSADVMAEHVRWIVADAELDVDDDAIDHVVRAGGGSARDTLSALDQVVAAGGVARVDTSTTDLLQAMLDQDASTAVATVSAAVEQGRDPRVIGSSLIDSLRAVFLSVMGAPLTQLSPQQREQADQFAGQLSPAAITRALEVVGTALIDMRQSPDPRIDLEVALVRITRPDADNSIDGLIRRISQLEEQVAAAPPGPAAGSVSRPTSDAATMVADEPETPAPAPPPAPASGGPADGARAALAQSAKAKPSSPRAESAPAPAPPPKPAPSRVAEEVAVDDGPSPIDEAPPPADVDPSLRAEPETSATAPAEPEPPAPAAPPAGESTPLSLERVIDVWSGPVKTSLSKKTGAMFDAGRFVSADDGIIEFVAPGPLRSRCEAAADEVGQAFSAQVGGAVTVRIVDGPPASPPPASSPSGSDSSSAPPGDGEAAEVEVVDLDDLVDAPAQDTGTMAQITTAWPGATEVTEDGQA